MSFATDTKTKYDAIVDEYGNTISVIPITTVSNKMGDKVPTRGTAVNYKGITSRFTSILKEFEEPGDVLNSDLIVYMKSNATLKDSDNLYIVSINGTEYRINDIYDIEVQDTIIAKRVGLVKSD